MNASFEFSAKTPYYSSHHSPTGTQGLWHTPGLELPAYIQNVVKGVMKSGKSRQQAIPIAIGRIKVWAGGGGNVTPEVRAAAAKALAEWEALKSKRKNMSVERVELAFTESLHPRVTGAANGGEFKAKSGGSSSSSSSSAKGKKGDKGPRNPQFSGKSDDELSKMFDAMMAMSPPPNPDLLNAVAQELYVRGVKKTKKTPAKKKPASKKKSSSKSKSKSKPKHKSSSSSSSSSKKKPAAKKPAAKKPTPTKKPPTKPADKPKPKPVIPGPVAPPAKPGEVQKYKTKKLSGSNIDYTAKLIELAASSGVLSNSSRKAMASKGVALPDGSFPIPTTSHVHKAIQAFGRCPPAKRPKLVSHIRKRARVLGMMGHPKVTNFLKNHAGGTLKGE